MNDTNQPHGLKYEWAILIESFIDDAHPAVPPTKLSLIERCKLNGIEREDLGSYSRALSQHRKNIYQTIEKIKQQIEGLTVKAEKLLLVGSGTASVQAEIARLNEAGEKLSAESFKIDQKVKSARQAETDWLEFDSAV